MKRAILGFCAVISFSFRALAVEAELYDDSSRPGILVAYAWSEATPVQEVLFGEELLADHPDLRSSMEGFPLTGMVRDSLRRTRALADHSVVLFHKRLPSRYSYNYWADLHTGFGEIFPHSKLGSCRTNGAGVEEPNCLYVKISLRF